MRSHQARPDAARGIEGVRSAAKGPVPRQPRDFARKSGNADRPFNTSQGSVLSGRSDEISTAVAPASVAQLTDLFESSTTSACAGETPASARMRS